MPVVKRIPHLDIDAVDDPGELERYGTQQPVEAHAELGRLDLGGIGGAHGGDHVGEYDAGLHHVDVAVVFHDIRTEQLVGQKEHGPERGLEYALVGEVVDRVAGGEARQSQRMEICRDECGLPVVAVDEVHIFEDHGQLHARARKEGEPLEVVGEVPALVGVVPVPVEVQVVFNKIRGTVGEDPPLRDTLAREERDVGHVFKRDAGFLDGPVERHDHIASHPLAPELGGQRRAHSPNRRFGKGNPSEEQKVSE